MRRRMPWLLVALLILAGCGGPAAHSSPAVATKTPLTAAPVTVLAAGTFGGLSAISLPSGQAASIATPNPVLALAAGPGNTTVLITTASSQPVAANLGLTALSWQRATGQLSLLSLAFTTPHQGSMYTGDGFTELSGIVGTVGAGPFAVNAFHGGGIGEIFAVLGPNFAPLADYRLPAHLSPTNLTLEGNMAGPSCQPQVLALSARSQDFLVRGTVPSGQGFSCRYFTLSPAGGLSSLAILTQFASTHPLLAATISASGQLALLTAAGQIYLAPSLTAPPTRAALFALKPGALTYPDINPAALFWSPAGRRLVAAAGGEVALYQAAGSKLTIVAMTRLPAGSQSVLAVFGARFTLPTTTSLRAVAQAAQAAAQGLEVTIPGPYTVRPNVRLSLQVGVRAQCVPLGSWVGPSAGPPLAPGMATADGCPAPASALWYDTGIGFVLVPPGAHPSSDPAVQAATARAWLLMPQAGWMETGTYHLFVSSGSFHLSRSVTIGP